MFFNFRSTVIIITALHLMVACVLSFAIHFYCKHREHEFYLTTRKEFIEINPILQMQMAGMTFVYEPRGGLIMEAERKSRGIYKIKE